MYYERRKAKNCANIYIKKSEKAQQNKIKGKKE